MKVVRLLCFLSLLAVSSMQFAVAAPISDFSNFSESGNMLNSASHNPEANFATSGTAISISQTSGTTGSVTQEIFGTSEFPSFTTPGYRLQVDLTTVDSQGGTNERVGLMTSSTIPAGGPASGDVRAAGDYFYWVYRAGNVQAGMFSSVNGEEEGGLVGVGTVGTDITGLYMERLAGSWDLGYIDGSGNDVFVQNRSSINGDAITADGTNVGLYVDMRSTNSSFELNNLQFIPEPTSLALLGLSFAGLIYTRRR